MTMSEYMFLFRGGAGLAQSPAEMQANLKKWGAWIETITKQGKFTAGEPLAREGRVMRGSRRTISDGPFAEAKDLVGGYLLIKAGSLDEATELARGCPILESEGSVEVRPIQRLDM
jgi:hypothetical protein